jgi:hypothetical protein
MKNILFYITYPIVTFVFVTVVTFSGWVIPTPKAEANFLSGLFGAGQTARESTQRLNNALLGAINGTSAATAAATTARLTQEQVLDGIAWGIAKQIVSSMIRSLINWVNSGFQGSPAFIQDLKQHLLGILDRTAGNFIQSLGGIGEFICSPFRLDVQAALSINYARARSGMPSGPTEGMCTLSGIQSNIENFLSGTVDSMDQWLQVTSNPQNTPYGAYLEAEARLNVALRNAAGQEVEVLRFNRGFLSRRVCEGTDGRPAAEGTNCRIVTPGEIIANQVNESLGAGQRILIEADEINELIGALLNQLALTALQGINGLLGLGGNTSYTDPSIGRNGNSYLDEMVRESEALGINSSNICQLIDTQAKLEVTMIQLSNLVINSTVDTSLGISNTDTDQVLNEARQLILTSQKNLADLGTFADNLMNSDRYTTATRTPAVIHREVAVKFSQMQQSAVLTPEHTITSKRATWAIAYPDLNSFEANPVLPWGTCVAQNLGTSGGSGL